MTGWHRERFQAKKSGRGYLPQYADQLRNVIILWSEGQRFFYSDCGAEFFNFPEPVL